MCNIGVYDMSSFTRVPPLKAIPPNYKLYKTTVAFEYYVGSEDSNDTISIPKGYETDGASIPKFAWSLIGGPLGKYAPAAVLHDLLYYTQTRTRKESDRIFLEAMKVLGVNRFKRWLMHKCVRVFGWRGWNRRKEEIREIR